MTETWKPGDILVFSGRTPISWSIRLRFCSPYSHVGIVSYVTQQDLQRASNAGLLKLEDQIINDWADRFLVFESSLLVKQPCIFQGRIVSGTQAHELETRLKSYNGRVWRMSLNEKWTLTEQQTRDLTFSLLVGIGIEYDLAGAGVAGTFFLKKWLLKKRAQDRSTLYCVEYVADRLKHVYRERPDFPDIEPGDLPPLEFVVRMLDEGIYDGLNSIHA